MADKPRRPLVGRLVPAALLTAAGSHAAPPPKTATKPAAKAASKPSATFKDDNVVRIKALKLTPALPAAGETVTVTLVVHNPSPSTLSQVEYKLSGGLAQQGKLPPVPSKGERTVTFKLKAKAGPLAITAAVDPSGKVKEPGVLRKDNQVTRRTVVTSATTQWAKWVRAAADLNGILIGLYKSATSVDGAINGATLSVKALKVGAVNEAAAIGKLKQAGVPADVAQAMTRAFSDTWRGWAVAYRANVSNAYPAFAALPMKSAPNMPNVPFSLAAGGSAGSQAAFGSDAIEKKLRAQLGKRLAEAGAKEAIASYAEALSGELQAWQTTQQVTQVIGKGSVPSFAPPYVPVGPVVAGDNIAAPSHLLD